MRKHSGKITLGIAILAVLLIPLYLAACARTQGEFVGLGADIYPPKSEVQEVLLTKSDIDRPYEPIGLVKASGDQYASEEQCYDKLRQVAGGAGADAVVKAHADYREKTFYRLDPTSKFRTRLPYTVKAPVCEGTAVIFTGKV
jgi:hypothetical protein